jgi:hypothetical protein
MSFTFRRLTGLRGVVKASHGSPKAGKWVLQTTKVQIGRSTVIVGRRVSIIANSNSLCTNADHTRVPPDPLAD